MKFLFTSTIKERPSLAHTCTRPLLPTRTALQSRVCTFVAPTDALRVAASAVADCQAHKQKARDLWSARGRILLRDATRKPRCRHQLSGASAASSSGCCGQFGGIEFISDAYGQQGRDLSSALSIVQPALFDNCFPTCMVRRIACRMSTWDISSTIAPLTSALPPIDSIRPAWPTIW
jgi:hypothetical protein